MLVFSRSHSEGIRIGDDIEVVVVEVRGDKVRIGVSAPRSVPVHRNEVYDSIMRQHGSNVSLAKPEPRQAESDGSESG